MIDVDNKAYLKLQYLGVPIAGQKARSPSWESINNFKLLT